MIDQATVEQIRNAANIVDVVSDYVSLRRSGANYKGLCPFHNERTPSFVVSPAKNYCRCFGCGKGGDPIGFLKEINNYTYREALIHLANKFHIEVKEVDMSSEEIAERQKRQTYLTLCEFVAKHYHSRLTAGDGTLLAHLNSKGIQEATANTYMIGYADAEANSLVKAIESAGFSTSHATDLGLVASMSAGVSDVIPQSVVFPIFNKTGKITAFAWQEMKQGAPFAVTMRSPVFNAQEAVFGIYQANRAISKAKSCYIVDSPTDVLMMHQNGMENVIAPLGESIERYTLNDIVKCVKDDSATIITACTNLHHNHRIFRIIDQLTAQGVNVMALTVTEESIANAITKCSAEAWRQFVETNKTDAITWKANVLLAAAGNNATDRIKAIRSTLRTIKGMRDEASKRIYLNVLSGITSFPAETLGLEMQNLR